VRARMYVCMSVWMCVYVCVYVYIHVRVYIAVCAVYIHKRNEMVTKKQKAEKQKPKKVLTLYLHLSFSANDSVMSCIYIHTCQS